MKRTPDGTAPITPEQVAKLAMAMPRSLIAEGDAEPLARAWLAASARALRERGRPIPFWPFDRALADALFEARRARRLVRGLESAREALEREAAGLSRTPSARPEPGRRRISRLLVVSADGSPRFEREVERLSERFTQRLAVLGVDCDEQALGGAVFGRARRARALLIDHKDAVVRVLRVLIDPASTPSADCGEASSDPTCPGSMTGARADRDARAEGD